MPITEPFDRYPDQYEQWFSTFEAVYETEIEALGQLMPGESVEGGAVPRGVEIGAGSGLFASRLGISLGVEPSRAMMEKARARGVEMIEGAAEQLPLEDASFDLSLMVTAICFLDDLERALEELRRILKPGGWALFGFVDRDSPLGRLYLQHKEEDVFYRQATFRSAGEVIGALERAGFAIEQVRQTVFGRLEEITSGQQSRKGHGEGGFVVLRARKPGG
jgi:SAM-dependent methyltransferase